MLAVKRVDFEIEIARYYRFFLYIDVFILIKIDLISYKSSRGRKIDIFRGFLKLSVRSVSGSQHSVALLPISEQCTLSRDASKTDIVKQSAAGEDC